MIEEDYQLVQARQLLARLERLSADSYWAHRASGMRGSLLRCINQIESARGQNQTADQEAWQRIDHLIRTGFSILENAAREIRVREIKPG
jgi:hypothetical protein